MPARRAGVAGQRGHGGAAVDQEVRALAVDRGVDPEMAVVRPADAQRSALRLLGFAALDLGQQPVAQRPKVIPEREGEEGGGEDQDPGQRHLEPLPDRHPAHREGRADEDQAAKKINESKGLIAIPHNSISIPSKPGSTPGGSSAHSVA